jgi:hypothetical protein
MITHAKLRSLAFTNVPLRCEAPVIEDHINPLRCIALHINSFNGDPETLSVLLEG